MKKIRGKLIIFIIILICCIYKNYNISEAKATDIEDTNFANVVLFAHFAGDTADEDKKYFEDNRDEIIKLYDGSHGRSATNYLNTISYGKFHLKNIFPQDDGKKITSYELNIDKKLAYTMNVDSLIIDELIKNVPEISNKIIDYDGDGYIDNLTVVLKGGNEQEVKDQSTFVLHKSDYGAEVYWSGKKISSYNILNTYSLIDSIVSSQSGVIAHEFLHTLGYPDLYRSRGNDKPVYSWDIMGAASRYMPYPLAYLRMHFSNWLNIETITETQTVTLDEQSNKDGNQAYIIKSPLSDDELFVIEFRKKAEINYTDEDSLDRGIGGSGIIVYRINTTVEGLSNNFNETGVYVFRPSIPGNGFSQNTEEARVLSAYLSKESGRTSIGSTDFSKTLEDGALTFSDGTNSGIVISDVSSSSGKSMTCKITIPKISEENLWKNTDFKDYTGTDTIKEIGILNYNNYIYTVTCSNNKIYTQVYDEKNWNEKYNILNVEESNPIVQVEIIQNGNDIYLFYSGYGYLKIEKMNFKTQQWEDVAKINDILGEFCVANNSGQFYISCIREDSSTARLININGNEITELGNYFSKKYCGQAKVAQLNGNIYVSVRWSNGNKIKVYKYNSKSNFSEIENSMFSGNYDMKSIDNKIYFALGKNTEKNASMYVFDGDNWKENVANTKYSFPEIFKINNEIYVILKAEDESGKAQIYRFNKEKNIFEDDIIDVDTAVQNIKITSTSEYIYSIINKKSDGKIVVKKRQYKSKEIVNPIPGSDQTRKFQFKDVQITDWHYSAIKYMFDRKYISGYNETIFAPNDKITRGMIVTILHNMEGNPIATNINNFPDVQDSRIYYYKSINWAVENRIVSGYDNGNFGPDDLITREQLAVILWNYSKYKGKNVNVETDYSKFPDKNQISNFAQNGMNWAVGTGVITGSQGKLFPLGNATRAEAASMIYKYCIKVK